MRLSIRALALGGSLVWGGAILFVMLGHAWWPAYGKAFLDVIASVYPGFPMRPGISAILIGTLYGMADGAIAGALLAWLYNLASPRPAGESQA